MLFQTSFGIPAEGVYTGLVAILIAVIAAMAAIIFLMAKRNMRLVDDNRQVTKDAIRGFEKAFNALQEIQLQAQTNSYALSEKIQDLKRNIERDIQELKGHLQHLRDQSRKG